MQMPGFDSRDLPVSPLFGEIAMSLERCPFEAVVSAVRRQEGMRAKGLVPDRIGRILIDQGHLTEESVRRILDEVERRTRTFSISGYKSLNLVARESRTFVFEGIQLVSRLPVRVVVLRFSLADSSEEQDRFLSANRKLLRFDHPNVLGVLAVGETESIPYIVMERIPGPALSAHLEESGPLLEEEGLRIFREVASGLHHAHTLGICHGGFGPATIHLPRIGGARVGDFRLFDPASTEARTVPYLSPEQACRGARHSIQGDVYSLGATMFHVFTGRPPFVGRLADVEKQHRRRPAPDPRVLAPALGEGVADLLLAMLQKRPARRPAGMEEVLAVLAGYEGAAFVPRFPVPRSPVKGAPEHGRLRSSRSGFRPGG